MKKNFIFYILFINIFLIFSNDQKIIKSLYPDFNKLIKKEFNNSVNKKEFYYYEILKDDKLISYASFGTGKGYGGKFRLLLITDLNHKILNVKLLENKETPGLGKKAETDEYMKKFIGTNTTDNPFPDSQDKLKKEDLDSITGATITFYGITDTIKKLLNLLKNIK